MTVVHEVFHIFGFSPTFNVKVKKMAADSDNDYLSKLAAMVSIHTENMNM